MLRFHNLVWLLWALWLLILPLKWLVAALSAACIHEVSHIAAVYLFGGRVRQVFLAPFGAEIDADGIQGWQELFCVVAGPAGSLLLVFLIHRFPLLGLCGLVQGCFNLLPVYPMDGGRAILLLLELTMPNRAANVFFWTEGIVFFLLLIGTVVVSIVFSLGAFPVCFCILAVVSTLLRKRP